MTDAKAVRVLRHLLLSGGPSRGGITDNDRAAIKWAIEVLESLISTKPKAES